MASLDFVASAAVAQISPGIKATAEQLQPRRAESQGLGKGGTQIIIVPPHFAKLASVPVDIEISGEVRSEQCHWHMTNDDRPPLTHHIEKEEVSKLDSPLVWVVYGTDGFGGLVRLDQHS
jgi:hypothetical protein